ncbi:glycogen debranching enzyme isoform X1 [Schistocerca cancellata]|uniref:glycogen debranching enzyme isoform X1 n=2 Tax=Schistocerca cancellata TaxID=274614 RepID=UPI002117C7C1|nr:glycogen debranching enzyme isoform X1 [Schistocerca cancellata]
MFDAKLAIMKLIVYLGTFFKKVQDNVSFLTVYLLEGFCYKKIKKCTFEKMPHKQSETNIGSILGFINKNPEYNPDQIRVLTLNDGEHQDSTLYRLQKGWRLQFRLGPTLFGRHVVIYCNHPDSIEEEFDRNQYRPLHWQCDSGTPSGDDTSSYAEVCIRRAGSFHYYFIYEGSDVPGPQGSGFFTVDPVLTYGCDEVLPQDCIQCQTVLAKCLGPFHTWEKKLQVARESGYNMIHFTPVQELGGSNSSYSISDQLKLNPLFSEENKTVTINDVESLITKMRDEWKVVSICDVVLNHTANESQWLKEHPECTYNLVNSPHLRPAYLLDALLHQLTVEVAEGKWQFSGIPSEVNCEEHLSAIRSALHGFFLPQIKVSELYMVDVNALVSEFQSLVRKRLPPVQVVSQENMKLKITQDPQYRRLKSNVDMELALQLYNVYRSDCFDEETRIRRCTEDFKMCLDKLNNAIHLEVEAHLQAAVNNTIASIRYFRVDKNGPRIKQVSLKNPLVPRYFTDYGAANSLKEFEDIMYSADACYIMAHNGWVMNDDPLRNFASPENNVYLRRELIAWGDSVKLRYGERPEDCPFLWQRMQEYVEQTARVFDGIRLDNCHSTPIPVAEYLLDAARRVRPDLYVVAELFTNSDQKDNIFVNRLGISSLIREAMSAWDSHEEGRLVYRYGGEPVGAFHQPSLRPLVPSVAHALFLDLTHDNPSPIDKRSVFDLLPSTALVSMACCASGSNRGYDELVPHHIHVVDEFRQYAAWTEDDDASEGVGIRSGIISAKKALNKLHFDLGMSGFNQVFVDQMDADIVAVTRHCPATHQSVVLVAHTAFRHPDTYFSRGFVKPLRVEGTVDEVILEASLFHKNAKSGGGRFQKYDNFVKDEKRINGLQDYEVELKEHIPLSESQMLQIGDSGDPNVTQINFKNFQPGSVVAIKVSLHNKAAEAIKKLRNFVWLSRLPQQDASSHDLATELSNIVSSLSLSDLNEALYRSDSEELDHGKGIGVYNIPGFGSLVYCGLQGFMSLLCDITPINDLGHPFCNNLREGNWMIDYISHRLKQYSGTIELGLWLEKSMAPLKEIPRYLVPSYFAVIISLTYLRLLNQAWSLMSLFVKDGSTFLRGLALGSVQCASVVHSSPLPQLSPNLAPPLPLTRLDSEGKEVQACVTLSAGLPHFATGYVRNWGRDTFIALRGLFILTGRYQDARYHILAYAACLRHGLIPNLLDGGSKARFNCRDAVWWWLHCIHSYVNEAPDGHNILKDKVSRLFPTDDSPALPAGQVDQPLHDVMQEALSVHFQGLCFRERNAGRSIDAHMTDKGFNNQIGVHPETGFVFGGNSYNCGTWMDKMGSSDKAGNRGKPATPRDGSAVEIVALCKSTLRWLASLHEQGRFPYSSVQRSSKNGTLITWTYKQWEEKIATNFEKCFYIDVELSPNEPRPDLVHRRGIYKDTYKASQPWADYQLRCNFPIAMVVAPEMFEPKHAWIALKKVEELLLGPLGMKTLDPADWNYCGDYDNANDSADPKVAHGFNYHQGPEWVWPVGYFLRACLHFAREVGGIAELERTAARVRSILAKHFTVLQTSPWRGLPELTNKDGAYCNHSCQTQAWSMASIIEVLHDLNQLQESHPIILDSSSN